MTSVSWVPFLVNHLWQSAFFMVFAWGLATAMKAQMAKIRYAIWMTASLKLLLPFSMLIGLGADVRSLFSEPVPLSAMAATIQHLTTPLQSEQLSSYEAKPEVSPAKSGFRNYCSLMFLVIWLFGAFAVSSSWLVSWRRLREIVRGAQSKGFFDSLEVRESSLLLEPGVFGIVRPILVLPVGLNQYLSDEQVRLILLHEAAHVRRQDNLTGLLHMIVEALFWFFPPVWWLQTRLIEERERACDEAVLQNTKDSHCYAETIVAVCRFYAESKLMCAAGVTGADLKKRISNIVSLTETPRLSLFSKAVIVASASSAIAIPMAAGLTHPSDYRSLSLGVNHTYSQASQSENSWQMLAGKHQSFEAASVRPSLPESRRRDNIDLGPMDGFSLAGGIFSTNVSLDSYIIFAFKIADGSQYRSLSEQLPKWAKSPAKFDVEARVEGTPTKDQIRLMMQALLTDRFKLALHTEMRELPVYSLVLQTSGKVGTQLREHTPSVPCPKTPTTPAKGPEPPPVCGLIQTWSDGGLFHLRMLDVSMETFAGTLVPFLGSMGGLDDRPTIDRTTLAGNYDLTFAFKPLPQQPKQNGSESEVEPGSPDLVTALREQLGLRLVKQNGRAKTYVIDHVEMPSAN